MTADEHTPDADGSTPNPYRDVARTLPKPVERPTGVTIVGVLTAVGGILGILMGLSTLMNTFIGPQISNAMVQAGPTQEAQMNMNKAMQGVTTKYLAANIVLSLAGFTMGSCLLGGGIALLRGKEWGRRLLLKTLLAMMAFECLRMIPYTMMQFEILPIIEQYMQELTAPPKGGGPAPPQFVGKLTKIMMLVAFAGWIVWTIIKLALYAMGHRYLRKPHVVRCFDEEAGEAGLQNP